MADKNYLKIFVAVAFVYLSFGSAAQITKVVGIVTDSLTGEPIPFVNIAFEGTSQGTITKFDGTYAFELSNHGDSVAASYVGYLTQKKFVQKGRFQTINFSLQPASVNLGEVVIKYKGNPAERILKKMIAHKKYNDKERFKAYQYELYNKIQIDVNNISDKTIQSKIMKPFSFAFDYMDTNIINGKNYLPMFLTESISDVYYRRNPSAYREIIKASRASGVENENVSVFLGEMYQDYNLYQNYVSLFDKNFVSPINDNGTFFYKYYLVDSAFIDDLWCYNIVFKPKRPQELTFTGNFWVTDTLFAIRKIEMDVSEKANLNFINDLSIAQEYLRVNDTTWMISKDKIVIDFTLTDNTKRQIGFYGTRTASFKNYILNQPKEDAFYNTLSTVDMLDSSFERSEEYWQKMRHEELNKNEKFVYFIVDTVKNIPAFKTFVDIINTAVTGYYQRNKIELGPFFNVYSYNQMEGHRFRIGMRTSKYFSTKVKPSFFVAYGTQDEKLKYGAGLLYIPNPLPRRALAINYLYDMHQIGLKQDGDILTDNNIFASVFRRQPLDNISMMSEAKFYYDHEFFPGLMSTFILRHRITNPVYGQTFQILQNNDYVDKSELVQTEIGLKTRISFKEKVLIEKNMNRTNLGTKYPVIELQYNYGIKDALKSDFSYHEARFAITQWFNISAFGWSKYRVTAGKYWGDLPYLLLELHQGNETYFYTTVAYNTMNVNEFVSDQYVSLYYAHHFGGLFLNRIPLLKKLKWREVAHVRGLYGTLDDDAANLMRFPDGLSNLEKPFYEGGAGIENIFKVFAVEGIWRLSHLDKPNAPDFIIKLDVRLDF